MIKIIIVSIILFIIFIILLLSFNIKIEYFNQNNDFTITVSGDYTSYDIDLNNVYYIFKSGTSTFAINQDINCDILLVGGGGGGGCDVGGGGGAGAVLFANNFIIPSGTYSIIVGSGGTGSITSATTGTNGGDTSININGTNYIAKGGGGGGSRVGSSSGISGANGGSGGGASHSDRSVVNDGGSSIKNVYSGWNSYGNNGGFGKKMYINGYGGGGGGGAGGNGGNAETSIAGNGGNGIDMSSIFGNNVGDNGWFAGGGGGASAFSGTAGFGNGGSRLFGGGGLGRVGDQISVNGLPNTGGGGGASGYIGSRLIRGGNGGSGVVIIKFNKYNTGFNLNNSFICSPNTTSSGIIKQIPFTDLPIVELSQINKLNDNMYNQSFQNGTINYTLTFSKYFSDNLIPTNLLLRNNKLTAFNIDNYSKGLFVLNNSQIGLRNYNEKGDYLHIRLSSPVKLKRYGFIADQNYISRAPGTWVLYTGIRLLEPSTTNPTLLVNNTIRLNNNNYCPNNSFTYIHDLNSNKVETSELLFIFTSLADSLNGNKSGNVLSFMQLLLFIE